MNETKRFAAVLVALSLLVAGVGMAAQGNLDTGETDTSSVNYMTDGETVDSTFNASSSEIYALPVNNASSSDLSMNITHNGTTYYEFSGTWDTQADATNSNDYIHNVTGADLARLPVTINENVTLNVTWWVTGDAANSTTITVYLNATDERVVRKVATDRGFVTTENVSPPMYKAWKDEYKVYTVDDNVSVNGSNTTVIYTLPSSGVADAFANMTEAESSGAFVFMMADLGDTPVPMFYKSAPSWYDSSTYGSYAVYEPADDMVTFTLAGDKADATKVAPKLTNDIYRVQDVFTVFKLAGGFDNPTKSGKAIVSMVM